MYGNVLIKLKQTVLVKNMLVDKNLIITKLKRNKL